MMPRNGFRLAKFGSGRLQILMFVDGRVGPELEPTPEIERAVKSGVLKLGLYDENSMYLGPEDTNHVV